MELFRKFTFDAAHRLPNLPEGHKCSNLHGHTFTVVIYVEGTVGAETGWVIDYSDIKAICSPVIDELDHKYLNEIETLENPTSENIAKFLWIKIKDKLPMLSAVEVRETPATGCRYSG